MTPPYYELHITIAGKPEDVRPKVEAIGWSFSAIDGDPDLGPGVKCYATKHIDEFHVGPMHALPIAKLRVASAKLQDAGCTIVRMKVELIVFDTKTGS